MMVCRHVHWRTVWQVAIGLLAAGPAVPNSALGAEPGIPRPRIVGDWWRITGNPDLGKYSSDRQEPVDFGIWQADDGTWQLWSCIRNTQCGGKTRLFYRWESAALEEPDWHPRGIAMEADPDLGETPGGLQAPYVIRRDDTYFMFYGDWGHICLATSPDGKEFFRVLNDQGTPHLFGGPFDNTRDAMVLPVGDLFFCYYTGHRINAPEAEIRCAVFCRTSPDLRHWSEPMMVAAGGIAATQGRWYGGNAECPFVLHHGDLFYLFRNQRYGPTNLNTQYASPDPHQFGVQDDQYRIGTLPVAAPEILVFDNEYFIAALEPALDGIRMARLRWND